MQLAGIFVGHLFFFLHDLQPNVGGYQILKTPQFFYRLFPPEMNRWAYQPAANQAQQPQQQQPQQPQRHNWGQGNALGRQ